MRAKIVFLWSLVLLLKIENSLQSPTGAPVLACGNMTPQHGPFTPQTTNAPITITVPDWIISKSVIPIVIQSQGDFNFRGFKIQARTQTDELIGKFIATNDVGLVNCSEIAGSAATHTNNGLKNVIVIPWEAPEVETATLFNFFVTIVESGPVFWINQLSGLRAVLPESFESTPGNPGETPVDSTTDPEPPTGDGNTSTPTPVDPDLNAIYTGCGETKTCFGIPDFCYSNGENCVSFTAVTYTAGTENFDFELLSTSFQNYVAMGLSLSKSMPDSSIIECVQSSPGVISAFTSWTELRQAARRDLVNQATITLRESRFINGRIYCNVRKNANFLANEIDFDLKTVKYYLLLASGTQITQQSIVRHDTSRGVSENPVLLTEIQNVGAGSSVSTLVLIHGSFMIVAWVGCTSIGIVMARYFKTSWQNRKCGGKDIWFVWHVMLMFLTFTLTLAGFIIIFVDTGDWTTSVHSVTGCVVLGLVIVQSVGAVFRPDPKDIARPLFNWMHRAFGNITHLLAIITIFFAVGLPRAALPQYTFYVLVAFASFYLFMHIIFMSVDICARIKQQKRLGVATSKDAPYKLLQKTLLGLFVIVILIFVIALLLIFNLDF